MKIFFLATLISFTRALSKSEIEVIRKELNSELTQLEKNSTNKSDENQVSSVNENDPTNDILRQMGNELAGNEGKDLDVLWQKIVDQRKVAENKDLAKLFADDNTKKSFSSSSDDSLDALLDILITDDLSSKRSADKVCKDKNVNCPNYKQQCNDKVYKSYFREICQVTCDVCDPCRNNKWSDNKCDMVVKLNLCQVNQFEDRLKKNCYKSCGYCRAPSPPACMMHPQGCCWDGTTFVKDGCQPCVDASNVGRLCNNLKAECDNKYSPGKWMKKNCPVSCKFCDPEKDCHDYPQYEKQCFLWKIQGKCKNDFLQQTFCLKTCNKCLKKTK